MSKDDAFKQGKEHLEMMAAGECVMCDSGIPHMTMLAIQDPKTGKTSLATHCSGMENILIVGALESAKAYWVGRMNEKAKVRDDTNNFTSDLH